MVGEFELAPIFRGLLSIVTKDSLGPLSSAYVRPCLILSYIYLEPADDNNNDLDEVNDILDEWFANEEDEEDANADDGKITELGMELP